MGRSRRHEENAPSQTSKAHATKRQQQDTQEPIVLTVTSSSSSSCASQQHICASRSPGNDSREFEQEQRTRRRRRERHRRSECPRSPSPHPNNSASPPPESAASESQQQQQRKLIGEAAAVIASRRCRGSSLQDACNDRPVTTRPTTTLATAANGATEQRNTSHSPLATNGLTGDATQKRNSHTKVHSRGRGSEMTEGTKMNKNDKKKATKKKSGASESTSTANPATSPTSSSAATNNSRFFDFLSSLELPTRPFQNDTDERGNMNTTINRESDPKTKSTWGTPTATSATAAKQPSSLLSPEEEGAASSGRGAAEATTSSPAGGKRPREAEAESQQRGRKGEGALGRVDLKDGGDKCTLIEQDHDKVNDKKENTATSFYALVTIPGTGAAVEPTCTQTSRRSSESSSLMAALAAAGLLGYARLLQHEHGYRSAAALLADLCADLQGAPAVMVGGEATGGAEDDDDHSTLSATPVVPSGLALLDRSQHSGLLQHQRRKKGTPIIAAATAAASLPTTGTSGAGGKSKRGSKGMPPPSPQPSGLWGVMMTGTAGGAGVAAVSRPELLDRCDGQLLRLGVLPLAHRRALLQSLIQHASSHLHDDHRPATIAEPMAAVSPNDGASISDLTDLDVPRRTAQHREEGGGGCDVGRVGTMTEEDDNRSAALAEGGVRRALDEAYALLVGAACDGPGRCPPFLFGMKDRDRNGALASLASPAVVSPAARVRRQDTALQGGLRPGLAAKRSEHEADTNTIEEGDEKGDLPPFVEDMVRSCTAFWAGYNNTVNSDPNAQTVSSDPAMEAGLTHDGDATSGGVCDEDDDRAVMTLTQTQLRALLRRAGAEAVAAANCGNPNSNINRPIDQHLYKRQREKEDEEECRKGAEGGTRRDGRHQGSHRPPTAHVNLDPSTSVAPPVAAAAAARAPLPLLDIHQATWEIPPSAAIPSTVTTVATTATTVQVCTVGAATAMPPVTKTTLLPNAVLVQGTGSPFHSCPSSSVSIPPPLQQSSITPSPPRQQKTGVGGHDDRDGTNPDGHPISTEDRPDDEDADDDEATLFLSQPPQSRKSQLPQPHTTLHNALTSPTAGGGDGLAAADAAIDSTIHPSVRDTTIHPSVREYLAHFDQFGDSDWGFGVGGHHHNNTRRVVPIAGTSDGDGDDDIHLSQLPETTVMDPNQWGATDHSSTGIQATALDSATVARAASTRGADAVPSEGGGRPTAAFRDGDRHRNHYAEDDDRGDKTNTATATATAEANASETWQPPLTQRRVEEDAYLGTGDDNSMGSALYLGPRPSPSPAPPPGTARHSRGHALPFVARGGDDDGAITASHHGVHHHRHHSGGGDEGEGSHTLVHSQQSSWAGVSGVGPSSASSGAVSHHHHQQPQQQQQQQGDSSSSRTQRQEQHQELTRNGRHPAAEVATADKLPWSEASGSHVPTTPSQPPPPRTEPGLGAAAAASVVEVAASAPPMPTCPKCRSVPPPPVVIMTLSSSSSSSSSAVSRTDRDSKGRAVHGGVQTASKGTDADANHSESEDAHNDDDTGRYDDHHGHYCDDDDDGAGADYVVHALPLSLSPPDQSNKNGDANASRGGRDGSDDDDACLRGVSVSSGSGMDRAGGNVRRTDRYVTTAQPAASLGQWVRATQRHGMALRRVFLEHASRAALAQPPPPPSALHETGDGGPASSLLPPSTPSALPPLVVAASSSSSSSLALLPTDERRRRLQQQQRRTKALVNAAAAAGAAWDAFLSKDPNYHNINSINKNNNATDLAATGLFTAVPNGGADESNDVNRGEVPHFDRGPLHPFELLLLRDGAAAEDFAAAAERGRRELTAAYDGGDISTSLHDNHLRKNDGKTKGNTCNTPTNTAPTTMSSSIAWLASGGATTTTATANSRRGPPAPMLIKGLTTAQAARLITAAGCPLTMADPAAALEGGGSRAASPASAAGAIGGGLSQSTRADVEEDDGNGGVGGGEQEPVGLSQQSGLSAAGRTGRRGRGGVGGGAGAASSTTTAAARKAQFFANKWRGRRYGRR